MTYMYIWCVSYITGCKIIMMRCETSVGCNDQSLSSVILSLVPTNAALPLVCPTLNFISSPLSVHGYSPSYCSHSLCPSVRPSVRPSLLPSLPLFHSYLTLSFSPTLASPSLLYKQSPPHYDTGFERRGGREGGRGEGGEREGREGEREGGRVGSLLSHRPSLAPSWVTTNTDPLGTHSELLTTSRKQGAHSSSGGGDPSGYRGY